MTTVLHLIETSGPGGAERMLISLVEGLDPRRYRSVICLLKEGWLAEEFRRRGVTTRVIPQRRGIAPGWIVECVRLIEQEKVDVLHAHEFTMNLYGCMGARLKRLPIVSTVHGKGYYPDRWQRRAAYRLVARLSTPMVAVSEDIRRFLAERVGVRPGRVTTIYNGIHVDGTQRGDGQAIRRGLGVDEAVSVVGCVASLYPVKGHTYLLRAARLVIRAFGNVVFLMAGRGPLLDQLATEAEQLGIARHVRFLGFREDVPALLEGFDVFTLSSLSEGLPLSVLEAMAAARPVVATAVGGIPELVREGETGFLVPPHDPESLAVRILDILGDRPLADKLGRNGRQRVRESFSLDRMVGAYEGLYESSRRN